MRWLNLLVLMTMAFPAFAEKKIEEMSEAEVLATYEPVTKQGREFFAQRFETVEQEKKIAKMLVFAKTKVSPMVKWELKTDSKLAMEVVELWAIRYSQNGRTEYLEEAMMGFPSRGAGRQSVTAALQGLKAALLKNLTEEKPIPELMGIPRDELPFHRQ